MRRRPGAVGLAAAGLAVAVAVVPACAGDGGGTPRRAGGVPATTVATTVPVDTTTTLAPAGGALPPADEDALSQVVLPLVAPGGWKLQRVALERDRTVQRTPVLSVYAQPTKALAADDYARTMAPLAAAVIPVLMDRYPGVGTIDLCQEDFEVPAGVAEPPPVTRILIRRPQLAAVPWEDLDLVGLLHAATTGVGADEAVLDLYVRPEVRATATWRAAAARL